MDTDLTISVVVCTRNRAEYLRRALESLAQPGQSPNVEVIVVDNDSRDHTREVAASFEDALPNLRYVFEPQEGISHARNRGIRCASGEVIAFIDDDVVVDRRWLAEIRNAFAEHHVDVLAGPVELSAELVLPAWWQQHYSFALGLLDLGDHPRLFKRGHRGTCGIGGNLCFRRSVFDTCGVFDVSFGRRGTRLTMGEDTELCHRALQNGMSILYHPAVKVFHRCATERTKAYLRRWFFRYGEWRGFASRRLAPASPRIDDPSPEHRNDISTWFSSVFSAELVLVWSVGYLLRWCFPYR